MKIVYYSQSGNTENMAEIIKKEMESAGQNVELLNVENASYDDIKDQEVIILGCPASGDEVIEEFSMEPFVENLSDKIKGKKVALFGSYGWGEGQWMEDWQERMVSYGAELVAKGLIVNEAEDGDEKCAKFAKEILKTIN